MEETKKQHNFGIDFLRITATFMICILHMLSRGGILSNLPFMSVSYELAWLLETAALCAVNCYGLISGFVGYKSKYRYARFVELWLIAVMVQFVFTVCQAVIMPGTVGLIDIVKIICPVLTRQYWYLSSYAVVFLLMPVLNIAVEKLERKQLKTMLIVICAVFCVSGALFNNPRFFDNIWNSNNEPFGLMDGYSGLWLSILYLIGAYFGKYGLPTKLKGIRALGGYVLSVVLAWTIRIPIDKIAGADSDPLAYLYFASYLSPLMLTAAISLLGLFSKMKISETGSKIIRFISPLTFSIYLIQVTPFLWKYLIKGILAGFADDGAIIVVLITFGAAIITFVACALIDVPRHYLFKALKIPQKLSKIEDKLVGDIWKKKEE